MSKLKEIRMKVGFSRPDIYRLIGIPVRTQENWESGARTIKEWEEKLIIEKIERLAKMKKYEIRKNTAEVKYRDRFDIKKGVTLFGNDQDPEVVETFDDLSEAREALLRYETSICISNTAAGTMYSIEEYYIEENMYDEDGDWLSGGDVWDFTQMEIRVVEEDSLKKLASFDNLRDAEKYINDYNGDEEIRLEF